MNIKILIKAGCLLYYLLSLSKPCFCQSVQLADYKPAKAKDGKDGSDRIFVIQLLRGGKSGKTGHDGLPGLNLQVYGSKAFKEDSTKAILVLIINTGKKADTFFVDPERQQLKILADGGDAGAGGSGEDGSAAEGKHSATSGGQGGYGGNGGTGGTIRVYFDSSAIEYVHCKCLLFSNEGGRGGYGGNGGRNGGNNNVKSTDGTAGKPGRRGPTIYLMDMNEKIYLMK